MPEKIITFKYRTYVISREFFHGLLVTYIFLTIAETLRAGIVSNYFNLNYLLIAVLIFGVVMVVTDEKGFGYRLLFKK
ncbi:MAG: hypothetical protein M3Q24_00510 [bacterium]|nr:hypothetical protein [bacterium]